MNRDDATLTLLRTLDPAPATPGQGLSARASVDLERILSSDPTYGAATAPAARRPRGVRRLVVAGGVAAVAASAFVVLPGITGGDQAFATWTPTAAGLSADERADAADHCRSSLEKGAGEGYEAQLDAATTAVSDQRGAWTTVLLAGRDGFTALCVTDESTRLFRDQFGSIGTPDGYRPPGPDEVIATDLGAGTIDAGVLSLAAGYAGSDVTGISYDSPTHGPVEATVSRGHFALWLPGNDLADASRTGVDVTVTHTDGSTSRTRLRLAS